MPVNDAIRLVAEQACQDFENGGNKFNAAGFSNVISRIAGNAGIIDGRIVRVILTGRTDIIPLSDGSHYLYVRQDVSST